MTLTASSFGISSMAKDIQDRGEHVPSCVYTAHNEAHRCPSVVVYIVCSNDVLREDRVTGDPISADKSNFLHPVIYYYRHPPGILAHSLSVG